MVTRSHDAVELSIVLVSYNMRREMVRTVRTLLPPYQREMDHVAYEVIVVDNGSTDGTLESLSEEKSSRLTAISFDRPSVSPVAALNHGLRLARGHAICACIDGARMFSPGLLRRALEALKGRERAAVATMSFHVGHDPQNQSVHRGYNQTEEDLLLASVPWTRNGYELFRISSLDPSSRFGLSRVPAETNSLLLARSEWDRLGLFDERFTSAGGGLANLEIWQRICDDQEMEPIVLLGEGTFHQFHGGAATNALVDPWDTYKAEFVRVTGRPYRDPDRVPLLYGRLHEFAREFFSSRQPPWP